MSRYSFKQETANGVVDVAYGFDHALGYFYQQETPDGELVVNLDSLFDGLTGIVLATWLCESEEHLIAVIEDLAQLPPGVNPEHLARMMLDLPF